VAIALDSFRQYLNVSPYEVTVEGKKLTCYARSYSREHGSEQYCEQLESMQSTRTSILYFGLSWRVFD
jgi:hypothetical protein